MKLIEVRPAYQEDPESLTRFARQQETYRSLLGTQHLPALRHWDETAVIVDWCEGPTLIEAPPTVHDMAGIAACLCAAYRLMPEITNHLTSERLRKMTEDLADDNLIPTLIHEAVLQELDVLQVPDKIRVGATFGDVSLPNFVRADDGRIIYIDSMGVVEREPMMINLEKMAANLPPAVAEELFQQVDACIGGVQSCRRWSVLARTLQVIRSKSEVGAVDDRGARQQKAMRAIADLEQHLQQKAV